MANPKPNPKNEARQKLTWDRVGVRVRVRVRVR